MAIIETPLQGRKPLLGAIPDESSPFRKGLVAHWIMNEGGGDRVFDASVYEHHGTLQSTTSWGVGDKGSVTEYNGTSDYINIQNTSVLDTLTSGDATYVLRVYNANSNIYFLKGLGGDREFMIQVDNSNRASIYVDYSGTDLFARTGASTNLFPEYEWYQLVITVPNSLLASDIRIWGRGGVEFTGSWITQTDGVGSRTKDPDGELRINRTQWSGYGGGGVSSIRCYNRILSDEEIGTLYIDEYPEYQTRLWAIPTVDAAPSTDARLIETALQGRKPLLGTLPKPHWARDGLVAHYLMNTEGGRIAYDMSGNENHGTFQSTTSWGVGEKGSTTEYNGSSDYISLPLSLTEVPITIICQCVCSAVSGSNSLVSVGDGAGVNYIALAIRTDYVLMRHYDGGTNDAQGPADMVNGRVYTLAGTMDTAFVKNLYINGDYAATNSAGGAITMDTWTIGISADSSPWGYHSGGIFWVRIYNKILTANQIKSFSYDSFPEYVARNWMGPYTAPPSGSAIMNQIQFNNLGSDLYNGVLI